MKHFILYGSERLAAVMRYVKTLPIRHQQNLALINLATKIGETLNPKSTIQETSEGIISGVGLD